MKCFLITLLFFCLSIVAYSQTKIPATKGITGMKNFTFAPPVLKAYYLSQEKEASIIEIKNSIPCLKPDMSEVAIIPTVKIFHNISPIPNSIKINSK
jgi:hypothetical protein